MKRSPFPVGEIAALAAHAFGDQAARAENAGRVELHEFHVLQRQARAQHHGGAIACLRVRAGASEISAAVAARGDHHGLRAEAMQRAVIELPRRHAAAMAGIVHDQIEREVLDEEFDIVPQRLPYSVCSIA